MLLEKLKLEKRNAMISKDVIKKTILEVALGEIQTQEARANKILNEEQAANVLRKIIKANNEVIALTEEGNRKDKLVRENEILNAFLPQTLSAEEVESLLRNETSVLEQINKAKDMASIGVAMKFLKSAGHSYVNEDVIQAVNKIKS